MAPAIMKRTTLSCARTVADIARFSRIRHSSGIRANSPSPESEHARTAREEHNAPILRSRYPEYLPLVEAYFASPEYRAEELMEYVNGKAGELTIAFDFSNFGPYFNGTFEAGLKLLDAATRVWPRHCRIGVYISPSAWRFHGLERFNGVQRLDFDDPSSKTTAIIRFGQPFKIEEVSRPSSRAPVVGIFMLDTIAYDCGYISANFDHNLWRYVFEHANVVYTNSRFTLIDFRRFKNSVRACCKGFHVTRSTCRNMFLHITRTPRRIRIFL